MSIRCRIAILGSRGIPAKYGGFETFAEELSVALVQRGFDVTVFCESIQNETATYKGVTLKSIAVPSIGNLRTLYFDLRSILACRIGYDVVYMLGYSSSIFCFLPRLSGTDVWMNMDGLEWKRSKWSKYGRVFLRAMEAFAMYTPNLLITDAEAIKNDLSSRYKNMPTTATIPYGCNLPQKTPDDSVLSKWGLNKQGYYLVLCRLEPENQVLEILQGFVRSGSTRKLIIVGNHTSNTPYVNRLLEIKDKRVHFIGTEYELERIEALRYYSHAYFHGHTVGGTNPSLLEAMACSALIIAQDNQFNREVLSDSGLFFKGSSDITAYINQLEAGNIDREARRHANRSRAIEQYSWNKIFDSYQALFQSRGFAIEPKVASPALIPSRTHLVVSSLSITSK